MPFPLTYFGWNIFGKGNFRDMGLERCQNKFRAVVCSRNSEIPCGLHLSMSLLPLDVRTRRGYMISVNSRALRSRRRLSQ